MRKVIYCLVILALLATFSPVTVQAASATTESEVSGAASFEGVIVEHINIRMADATVDLVRVRKDDGTHVWVVAGFLTYNQGLVYHPSGPWISSAEVAENVSKTVLVIYPYHRNQRLEELFASARYLFWRIHILEGDLHEEKPYNQFE